MVILATKLRNLDLAIAAEFLAKSEITGLYAATQSSPELQAFLD
jgi:hypothetical protein